MPKQLTLSVISNTISLIRWHFRNSGWWYHDMETLSVLVPLCEKNPPITGRCPRDSPRDRPAIRSFDIVFVVSMKSLLNKRCSCRWFEMPWHSCDSTLMQWEISRPTKSLFGHKQKTDAVLSHMSHRMRSWRHIFCANNLNTTSGDIIR